MITLNQKLKAFVTTHKRYNIAYGGRGSSKSWTVARMLLLLASQSKKRILCVREIQNSIRDSSHKLLKDQIALMGLSGFMITQDTIRHDNGSEFFFKGMFTNLASLKSIEGVDECWVEEGESISSESWEVLTPTIRTENSRIWVTFNPKYETDIIYQTFIINEVEDANVIKINWNDNPFFTKEMDAERLLMQRTNTDRYLHIWEGNIARNTQELIFANHWEIEDFETDTNAYYYYGADWGHANDPNTVIRCYITDNTLYIDEELCDRPYNENNVHSSTPLSLLPAFWDRIPEIRDYTVYADNARPETIDEMNRQGFYVEPAKKGKGSIVEGIEHLRSFDNIIIHSRCVNLIHEFSNYKYKIDKRSGQVTNDIVQKYDHLIDALRYALSSHSREPDIYTLENYTIMPNNRR